MSLKLDNIWGSIGIDEEYISSVSMRGVVSSTSETNLRKYINGNCFALDSEANTPTVAVAA